MCAWLRRILLGVLLLTALALYLLYRRLPRFDEA